MKSLTDKAREVFANDLYATQATGVVIESVEPRCAICSLKLNNTHLNAKGHDLFFNKAEKFMLGL